MSVDLSDPAIQETKRKVEDPNNETSCFLLHYQPNAQTPTCRLLSSSSGPVIQHFRTTLERCGEEVVFGYGEIQGKGLVLVYLAEGVGGVRRARAIVHSRAVASLFPDYSALITISRPEELTDMLVSEKLGLNQIPGKYQSPSSYSGYQSNTAGSGQPQNYGGAIGQHQPGPNTSDQQPRSRQDVSIAASSSGSGSRSLSGTLPRSESQFADLPEDEHLPSQPLYTGLSSRPAQPAQSPSSPYNTHLGQALQTGQQSLHQTPPSHSPRDQPQALSNGSTSSSPRTGLAPALSSTFSYLSPKRHSPPSNQNTPDRLLEMKGISSIDVFPDQTRPRQISLTSRLGSTFGSMRQNSTTSTPSVQASPPPPSSPGDIGSGVGRFKTSAIFGSFGRGKRISGQSSTPPTSPRVDEFGTVPPPPPPKDEPYYRVENGVNPSYQAENGANPHGDSSLSPPTTETTKLSPSPSARRALSDASQKRVAEENEVMERFRQQQLQHDSLDVEHRGGQESNDEMGLVYDDPNYDPYRDQPGLRPPQNTGLSMSGSHGPGRTVTMPGGLTPFATPLGERSQEGAELGGMGEGENQRRLQAEEAERMRIQAQEERIQAANQRRQQMRAEQQQEEKELRAAEEERQRPYQAEEEQRRDMLQAEATQREHRLRAEEQERENRLRAEEEDRQAELRAEEANQQARYQAEEEERQRTAAEQAERARTDAEERDRVAQAERARVESEERARSAAEEEARRVEHARNQEAARVDQERKRKDEAERVRKESLRGNLLKGKQSGGVMLSGSVTVQTTKSMIWRRRHFDLYPSEMRLYKNEGDSKPIQIIHLGPGSSVSQIYEESQVQGSFKISSAGPAGIEEFFLFTDSAEDKEVVLEGLGLALQ